MESLPPLYVALTSAADPSLATTRRSSFQRRLSHAMAQPGSETTDAVDTMTVSGFYGPGAYAAWCMTLAVSWIPIIFDDYSHDLHFISYALYTNWAALDAVLRLFMEGYDAEHLAQEAAARIVTMIGVSHALTQMAACQWKLRKRTRPPTDARNQRRCRVILCGLYFPSVWMVARLVLELVLEPRERFGNAVGPFWTVVWVLVIVFCNDCGFLTPNMSSAPIWLSVLAAAALCSYIHSTLLEFIEWEMGGKCYVMPCTTVKIAELDQAFALFVALFSVLYEYGPLFFTELLLLT